MPRSPGYVYLITRRHPSLPLEGGLCVELDGGIRVWRSCRGDYLEVLPYRGVARREEPVPMALLGGLRQVDFYASEGMSLKHYVVTLQGGKARLRAVDWVELFDGFVKEGEWAEVERAFENHLRQYVSSCVLGCVASLAAVGGRPPVDGMERRGELYLAPGLAVYIRQRSRHVTVVEAAAHVAASEAFRRVVWEAFRGARALHWAALGRLRAARPSLFLDVFLSRARG